MLGDNTLCFCAPTVEEVYESVLLPLPSGDALAQLLMQRYITHSEAPMHPRRGSSPHRRPRVVNYNFV